MAAPAEPPPKLPSSASQYELIGQIGVGATSQVWASKCTETQEDVAVKVIDLEHVNTNLEEIRNEIRVMSMSHHPNVVRYHCSFVNNSRYLWIVMPLMHGGSVMNIMQTDQKPLEEDIIAYVLLQVVHGIEYFHQSGHIHRDIKASNVLIDQMGHVYLGDFGVSAALQEAHNSESRELRQTFVGTPCWMAPEVPREPSSTHCSPCALRPPDHICSCEQCLEHRDRCFCTRALGSQQYLSVISIVASAPDPWLHCCYSRRFAAAEEPVWV